MRTVVIVLHVLSAVVGFGAILLTGVYAALARRRTNEAVRRYFRPGPNWAARALYLVPVFGVVLVATSNGSDDFAQLWVWASLLLWVLAAALAHVVVWPGERSIQRVVTATDGDRADLDQTCRRVARATVAIDVAFVTALVLMVARPGSGG